MTDKLTYAEALWLSYAAHQQARVMLEHPDDHDDDELATLNAATAKLDRAINARQTKAEREGLPW